MFKKERKEKIRAMNIFFLLLLLLLIFAFHRCIWLMTGMHLV